MKQNNLPCQNLFCRLNKGGACDAEDMLDLLCSGYDFYKDCGERREGRRLMKVLESIFGKKFRKDNKGGIGYDE